MYKKLVLINNINGDNMINEIMNSKIIYGNIDDNIDKISKLMKDNNIGFIPIKNNEEYIGVITDRDLALSISSIKDKGDNIEPYITKDLFCINKDDNIEDALNIMKKHKVKRLLVKEKDNIVGVLSLSDILNHTDDCEIIKTIKCIFSIKDNTFNESAEIDEFYL